MAEVFKVRMRDGSKGPGKVKAVLGSKEDAKRVQDDLQTEHPDMDVFVKKAPDIPVMTYDEWRAAHDVQLTRQKRQQDILSKLTPEEIEQLKEEGI